MDTANNQPKVMITPRLVLGIGLAAFGLILTLDRLHLVDARVALRFWPVLLIAIGVQQYFNPGAGRHQGVRSGNGLIWIVIGGWLLLNSLRIVRVGIWELFWPLVLIVVGVSLVMQTWRRSDAPANVDDRLSIFAVLGGGRRSIAGPFRGGEITAFMGGGQIDLRQATIPDGEAAINIVAVMGGFEVITPPDWVVSTPIVPVLGGIEDKRLPQLPQAAGARPPRLILRGFVMMGGITIR
jgi:hypothetical protein